MDSMRVSEAPDTGSIPVEATKPEGVEIETFSFDCCCQFVVNMTDKSDCFIDPRSSILRSVIKTA